MCWGLWLLRGLLGPPCPQAGVFSPCHAEDSVKSGKGSAWRKHLVHGTAPSSGLTAPVKLGYNSTKCALSLPGQGGRPKSSEPLCPHFPRPPLTGPACLWCYLRAPPPPPTAAPAPLPSKRKEVLSHVGSKPLMESSPRPEDFLLTEPRSSPASPLMSSVIFSRCPDLSGPPFLICKWGL